MRELETSINNGNNSYLTMFGANRKNLLDFWYFIADSGLMVFQYGSWEEMCPMLLEPAWQNSEDVLPLYANYILQN